MFGDRYFGKRYFGNRYFGPGSDSAPPLHPPGGDPGIYWRPKIYVDRDWNPVDIHRNPELVPELAELLDLSPEVLAALLRGIPIEQPHQADMSALLDAKMGRMLIDRQLQAIADDEAIIALLLAS